MMLKPPRHAKEAFDRLTPDLEEIADFINHCRLTAPGRMQLADLLGDYFHRVAASGRPTVLRVVGNVDATPDSSEGHGTV
jgi:hypothetical protein